MRMPHARDSGMRIDRRTASLPARPSRRAVMSDQPAVQDFERPRLRLRDCYWFFGPLVLMVELNMMSKSVIHAFLARTDAPSVALAAFNAAFTFYFAITAASEVTTVLCLSFLKSRTDALRLRTFAAIV